MAFFSCPNIRISGMAAGVPPYTVKAEKYTDKFGEKHVKKHVSITGVKEHREVKNGQTTSDLGYAAADVLLNTKKIKRSDIGLLVFVSHTPDYKKPATAYVLQKRLGLRKECVCFDINLGCSGFVYAVQIAASLFQTSNISKALIINGETGSRATYSEDESLIMLIGDAAAATLLERSEGSQITGMLWSEGDQYSTIITPAGGYRNMDAPSEEMVFGDGVKRNLYYQMMDGISTFNFSVRRIPKAVQAFLEQTEQTLKEFDYYLFHQANAYILKQILKRLKLEPDKVPMSLDRYGNTSSASIPLTLCDAFGNRKNQKIKVLMCGFGVGLSYGVMSAELSVDDIYPVIETNEIYKEGIINSPKDWDHYNSHL